MLGSVVTIGIFDGVHKGHQATIEKTVSLAKDKGLRSVALTFDRHPLETLKPEEKPDLLTSLEEKISLMKKLGIDHVVVLEFTKEFSQLSAEEFLKRILIPLNVKAIVVGEGFHFGSRRAGDTELLEEYGKKHRIKVSIQPLIRTGAQKISSSQIRRLLKEGDIDRASKMLGRFPTVKGVVIHGDKRGRALGFPSINIHSAKGICLPKVGVYAGLISFDKKKRMSAINLGYAPTFGGRKEICLEAYILDFEEELYGKEVEVEFRARLRDEIPFPDAKSLAEQLRKDAQKVRHMIR
jgi:riboflavin kinase/FMN adenylyltransferase